MKLKPLEKPIGTLLPGHRGVGVTGSRGGTATGEVNTFSNA